MSKGRFLPEFITVFTDRHGKPRYRFRRKGYVGQYINAPLGSAEFLEQYRRLLDAEPIGVEQKLARLTPGSIDDLVGRYVAVPTRLGPTDATQKKIRAILYRFRDEVDRNGERRGSKPAVALRFDHVDAIIARRRAKNFVDKRWEGGPEAARKLRKELLRLFDFGVKLGLLKENPVSKSDLVKLAPSERSTGFHTWTEAEIARYQARHPLGSRARLAMELMLWTAQRRVDSIHLGRQHVRDGRFEIRQTKGAKAVSVMIAPQLADAIEAMAPADIGDMVFLVNDRGKPFTNAGFGNKMREWCDQAGLPQCTSHGLRKAAMRRMAEHGLSNQAMKAVSGHTKDDEVARYTADANKRQLADGAITRVSNLHQRLDTHNKQGADNA